MRRLLLSIHDASLPGDPADDLGRGAPLSRGGRAFMRFVSKLGFDGLQLGPQGETTPFDPSPYDATIFGRSTACIAIEAILPPELAFGLVAARPQAALRRAAHDFAQHATDAAIRFAWERSRTDRGVRQRLDAFAQEHALWLDRAELYEGLAAIHAEPDWRRWPARDRDLFDRDASSREQRAAEIQNAAADPIALYRFGQFIAHEQHQRFRGEARALGLVLSGDLQVGISHRDLWSYRELLLPSVRMGAPPSRTNPDGQAWGYGLLDPVLYGDRTAPGAALRFMRARAQKLLDECDSLRVDHPHGMIDPWVYPESDAPERAVQSGARLFSSPDDPRFSRFAIAQREQIDGSEPPYADRRVRGLTGAQVDRYALLFDALVETAVARGLPREALIVEVLSTQPDPVRRVLERHGLGRFRVTQKASMDDPADVYRAENARPQDWIMAGTHDTESLWTVAERWVASGAAADRARYLASRLVADDGDRARWAERTARSADALARAQLADLFVGPAQNVMIFFSDLLGMREVYNRPGTVSPDNWTLRVPPDFEAVHARAAGEGRALDLPKALAIAIRARGTDFAAGHRELLEAFDRQSPPGAFTRTAPT